MLLNPVITGSTLLGKAPLHLKKYKGVVREFIRIPTHFLIKAHAWTLGTARVLSLDYGNGVFQDGISIPNKLPCCFL
ncbi:MAG TPA: hypothetical protein VEY10_16385 [Flavisolibacter sp.]|nr:hypothetical protein [Flavisolibacter sp.]